MDSKRLLSMIVFWVPFALFMYSGYQVYVFLNQYKTDPESNFYVQKSQVDQVKKEIESLEKKNKAMQEFLKGLEKTKVDISEQSLKLSELKAAMSEKVDVPEFMKLVVTEAKRAGLTVLGIKPKARQDLEYYREFPFELKLKGVYAQMVTFMGRIANLERLIRIDAYSLKPVSSASSRFVEIEGEFEVKTFGYLGSQADQVGQAGQAGQAAEGKK